MKLSEFLDGLSILTNHYDGGNGYHLGAEHDQIYLYKTDTPLSAEEVERMKSLGWFQPEQYDGSEYDPENGWSAFV